MTESRPAPDAPQPLALRAVIWYQRTFTGGAPTCRFYPSCSSYAREALELHGTRRGLWLAARRLARCRPFGPSGVDPVPRPDERSSDRTSTHHHSGGCDPLGKAS